MSMPIFYSLWSTHDFRSHGRLYHHLVGYMVQSYLCTFHLLLFSDLILLSFINVFVILDVCEGFLRDFVFTQRLESTKVHLPNEFPRLTTRWRPQQKGASL